MKTGFRNALTGAVVAAGIAAVVIAAVLLVGGCAPSKPAVDSPEPAPAPPPPAASPLPSVRLRVASLDVSKFSGRIEQAPVDELAKIVADRKIDVLALQGVTRYPTVKTRLDLIDALAAAADMRQAFGETISLSGRQSGNAVLSAYPVASSDAKAFEGVSGLNFEGAVRVIVDAGARPLVVVSTLLPAPLSGNDRAICMKTIEGMTAERGTDPLLVMGNLPAAPGDGWKDVGDSGTGGRLWYTPGPVEAGAGSSVASPFGTILIADIDIYPQGVK